MRFRFFLRTRPNGDPLNLFILAFDDDNQEMFELMFNNGEFKETTDLMKNIIDGFQDMKEITEKEAMSIYAKDGLKEALSKRFS